MMKLAYVDSSAFTKLLLPEKESAAMRRVIRRLPRKISSAILPTEVARAVRRVFPKLADAATQRARHIELVAVDARILAVASSIEPASLRTLDAIHLASALSLGSDLERFLTYDSRLAAAAAAAGIRVESPA